MPNVPFRFQPPPPGVLTPLATPASVEVAPELMPDDILDDLPMPPPPPRSQPLRRSRENEVLRKAAKAAGKGLGMPTVSMATYDRDPAAIEQMMFGPDS